MQTKPKGGKKPPQKMSRKKAAELAAEPKTHRSPLQLRVEKESGKPLTQRQKKFAEYFVEGIYTHARAARMAGYAPGSAAVTASQLLNPKMNPHVCAYVAELQEEREKQYGVTLSGQLKRLSELSRGAESAGQYSAAINAEKLRSALGGLTTDRRETINRIDQMTKDEILNRLSELQRKFPQAFQVIEGQYDVILDAKAIASPVEKQ
jgi:hypothetical protein